MTPRNILIAGLAVLVALGSLYGQRRRFRDFISGGGNRVSQQYEHEMVWPVEDAPDARDKTEWMFGRLRYPDYGRGFGRRGRYAWGTDANKADRVFLMGVRRLTRLHARSAEQVVDIDDEDIFQYPWLYAVEVGNWQLNDVQARRLRDYLLRGGFLMVDDFHGVYEWEMFMESLERVFPKRPVVEMEDSDSIFHVLYNLDQRFQIPGQHYVRSGQTWEKGGYEPRWRAVRDDHGRIMLAICHNMDLGDAWEHADEPEYPQKFGWLAYQIGVNYVIYAMTH